MKKIITCSVFAVIFCLALAQSGLPSGDIQSEISTIRQEIEALKQDVESLKQEVSELRKGVPGKFQVAVFPSSLTGEGIQYEGVVVSALNTAFENTETFIPVYSKYVLEKNFGAKPLPPDILQDRMWTRKSRWDLFEPAVQEVQEAGRRLGVDLVLMISVVIPGSERDHMAVYLVDVDSGKLYAKTTYTRLKNILSGVLYIKANELVAVINKEFWVYKMDKGM